MIVDIEPWLAAVLLGALMASSWAAGWRTGRAIQERGGPPPEGKLDDAALALLGLLLAFTFSMALGKYDRRREAVVNDSNAIGDFYTCATLVPDPVRTRLQGVIRDYARLRLELGNAVSPSREEIGHALERFDAMHGQMTALVGEALAAGTPIAIPLTNTLNAVTSSQASRLAALRDRLPESAMLLLGVAATLASVLMGRQQGSTGRASLPETAAFIVIVSMTAWVTVDLNHPTRGFIRVSQEPMQRLFDSMGR